MNGNSLISIANAVWEGRYKNIGSCQAALSGAFSRRGWKMKGKGCNRLSPLPKPAKTNVIFSVPIAESEKVTKLTPELRARIKAAIDKQARSNSHRFSRVERSLAKAAEPLRSMKLPDDVVIAAHRRYVDEALAMNKLGEAFMDRYSSAEAASAALKRRFCELGLPMRTQRETWAAKRRLTGRSVA